MAGATLTTLSNILKDYYLPPVVEQLNNEVLLLQRLESRSEDLFGNQAVVPVHSARSGGIGPALEGAALPAAGNQQYKKATYDLKYMYGRVGVTGPSIAKTASDAGAFLRALKAELDGIRVDLKRDVARQVHGSGLGNGLIAQCGTTTGANVVVLSSTEMVRKGHLYVGMVVDIGTSPGATSVATGRNITAIDTTAGTITIDGAAVTTSASHFVARSGAGGGEITSVSDFVSTTAGVIIGNLNPATAGNEVWENPRLMNAGTPRSVSIDLIAQAVAQSRINGGEPSLMTGSLAMERAIFLLLQSQVRYTDPDNLDGGFKALEVMGRPFVADRDAVWKRISFLQEEFIKVFSNRDWHFLDEDGLTLKWVSGFDKWEAVLARYLNIGPTRRNTHVVLGDLTDNGV